MLKSFTGFQYDKTAKKQAHMNSVRNNYLVENPRANKHLNEIVHYKGFFQFVWFTIGHVSWAPWQHEI